MAQYDALDRFTSSQSSFGYMKQPQEMPPNESQVRKHQAYRRSKAFEAHDIELLYRTIELETQEDRVRLAQSAREEIEAILNDDKGFDHEVDAAAWENKE